MEPTFKFKVKKVISFVFALSVIGSQRFLEVWVKAVALMTNQIKMLKLSKQKKLALKLADQENDPQFLKVRSRDTVLVGENEICKVLSFTGGSRDPDAPSLFQVANVDTGEIKHIHAAEVKEIVSTYEQEVKQRLESPTSYD